MMLRRALSTIIAVIAAGSGEGGLNTWFGLCEGPIRANRVVDGDPF